MHSDGKQFVESHREQHETEAREHTRTLQNNQQKSVKCFNKHKFLEKLPDTGKPKPPKSFDEPLFLPENKEKLLFLGPKTNKQLAKSSNLTEKKMQQRQQEKEQKRFAASKPT